jgi:hypothetical protein
VSASPIRRRLAVAAVALASLLVLGGCTTGQRAPGDYEGAEDNFLEGCVQIADQDNQTIEDGDADVESPTEIKAPQDYCQCVFDAISGPDGVPFSEFKKIQSTMQDTGGPLPDSYLKVIDDSDCDASSSSGKS